MAKGAGFVNRFAGAFSDSDGSGSDSDSEPEIEVKKATPAYQEPVVQKTTTVTQAELDSFASVPKKKAAKGGAVVFDRPLTPPTQKAQSSSSPSNAKSGKTAKSSPDGHSVSVSTATGNSVSQDGGRKLKQKAKKVKANAVNNAFGALLDDSDEEGSDEDADEEDGEDVYEEEDEYAQLPSLNKVEYHQPIVVQAESSSSNNYFGVVKLNFSSCLPHESKTTRPFREELIELNLTLQNQDDASGEAAYVFHRYVTPTEFPKLTQLTVETTGVRPENLSGPQTSRDLPKGADYQPQPLDETLRQLELFLKENGLVFKYRNKNSKKNKREMSFTAEKEFVLIGDGQDEVNGLRKEMDRKGFQMPPMFKKWVDLKQLFFSAYGSSLRSDPPVLSSSKLELHHMLEALLLDFEGDPASIISWTENLTKVVAHALRDGIDMETDSFFVNSTIVR